MSRPIYELDLSPRPNRHRESIGQDVMDVIAVAALAFLACVLVVLVFI